MIDFATLQGLTIPEGVVTQISSGGMVLWVAGGKFSIEVKKITSDTYAGETTYTGEQFILLDIYPKTNGTVTITYGGLTKAITDTSGSAEPNAIQVFFGTFNGVSDSVATPESGKLTIEGDYRGVGVSQYSKKSDKIVLSNYCSCVTSINDLGTSEFIPNNAYHLCSKITKVRIPRGVTSIENNAFYFCNNLETVTLPSTLTSIGNSAFANCPLSGITIPSSVISIGENPFYSAFDTNKITVEAGNTAYKIDGNCLIEIATNNLICGFSDSIIPSYVTSIRDSAFQGQNALTSVTIPSGVTNIGKMAFCNCEALTTVIILATTPPTLGVSTGEAIYPFNECAALASVIVPAGCGEVYKAAEGWSTYADKIVEAS